VRNRNEKNENENMLNVRRDKNIKIKVEKVLLKT
jgi:hypothetical protein